MRGGSYETLHRMREMIAKELRGSILHDELVSYLKNYNVLPGRNVYAIYDMILAEQDDPKDFLYLDIAKATAIVRSLSTVKDSGEKVICRYLQQADALTNTLQLYNFSYSFLQWLIAKYGEFGMTAEVLVIEKEIERRGFHETREISAGLARYFTKEPRNEAGSGSRRKSWSCSRNCIHPEPKTNDYKYSKKRAAELARESENARLLEKLYPDYICAECKPFYNDQTGLYYLAMRFYKKTARLDI